MDSRYSEKKLLNRQAELAYCTFVAQHVGHAGRRESLLLLSWILKINEIPSGIPERHSAREGFQECVCVKYIYIFDVALKKGCLLCRCLSSL